MFRFAPQVAEILRESGADTYLPIIDTYTAKGNFVHITPNCVNLVAQPKLFLDTLAILNCASCASSPQWKLFEQIHDSLVEMGRSFLLLRSIESCTANIDTPVGELSPASLGNALGMLRDDIALQNETFLDAPEMLLPLVEMIDARASAANKKIKTFLRSPSGREMIEEAMNRSAPVVAWEETDNALLFVKDSIYAYGLALAEAYGVEVSPGVFLARASTATVEYMDRVCTSSKFYLEGPVPPSVLYTMGSLWEPGARTALGDAAKALNAAWYLTPESTYS